MIKQPKNIKTKGDIFDGELVWNPNFANMHNANFNKAQEYIDSRCISLMKPFTPFQTGILEKLAHPVEPGLIKQDGPYAKYQYYGKLMVSPITGSAYSKGEKKVLTDTPLNYSKAKHPQAGSMWFEKMKAANKDKILKGAEKIAKGG